MLLEQSPIFKVWMPVSPTKHKSRICIEVNQNIVINLKTTKHLAERLEGEQVLLEKAHHLKDQESTTSSDRYVIVLVDRLVSCFFLCNTRL